MKYYRIPANQLYSTDELWKELESGLPPPLPLPVSPSKDHPIKVCLQIWIALNAILFTIPVCLLTFYSLLMLIFGGSTGDLVGMWGGWFTLYGNAPWMPLMPLSALVAGFIIARWK